MTNNNQITHRTRAIIGFRAAHRNQWGASYFNGPFSNTRQIDKNELESGHFGESCSGESIHSDVTMFSQNDTFEHAACDSEKESHSDGRYHAQSYSSKGSFISNGPLSEMEQSEERFQSWRSYGSIYSSRRGSASVIGSIRNRSLANRRSRNCFDCFFVLIVLLITGLLAFGFVFQDDIRKSPIVESLVGKKRDRDKQVPSRQPSQAPTVTFNPTLAFNTSSRTVVEPSQTPTIPLSAAPSTTIAPSSTFTGSRTDNKLPSFPSQEPSLRFGPSNFTAQPSTLPTRISIDTRMPVSAPKVSFPSEMPQALSTKAPFGKTSYPSLSSVAPSRGATLLHSDFPSSLPSTISSSKPCNSSSYDDRQSRYEDILTRMFTDASEGIDSKYEGLIYWLSYDTYLDVCETAESLLLERMVWASIYFELQTNYVNADGWNVTTLGNYLTSGSHCNRYDGRFAYFAREWAVKCNTDGFITELEIFGQDDRNEGEFPAQIIHLTKLKKIAITNSPKVYGTIPSDLFHLEDLEYIDFTNLGLSGVLFPPSFFAINNANPPSKRLKVLKLGSDASLLSSWYDPDKSLMKEPNLADLYYNFFPNTTMNNYESTIFPAEEILSFERLEMLHIENANLVGNLPNLTELSHLKSLSLWGNRLTGPIPSFPQGIEVIRLKKNMLIGTLPDSIGQYRNLTALELGSNPLSGTIPSTWGNLTNLKSLHLYNNNLEGTIPDSISSCSDLETLFLEDNVLTGSIPAGIGHFSSLENENTVDRWIDLSNNMLIGTLPVFLQSSNIRMFKASQNRLEGPIPVSLLQRNTWYIHLDGNMLAGTIPKSINETWHLKEFLLHDNQLTGSTIPSNGGRMTRIQTYHDNYIRGVLDPMICNALNETTEDFHLTSDCNNYVECDCCTECYDGKIVTSRPSLSPAPSRRPSAIPTKASSRPSFRACPTPAPKKDSKSSPTC